MKKSRKSINLKSNSSISTLPKAEVLSKTELVQIKGGIRAEIIAIG